MKSIKSLVVAILVLVTSVLIAGCQTSEMPMTGPSDQVAPMVQSANPQGEISFIQGGKGGKTPAPPDTSHYGFAR